MTISTYTPARRPASPFNELVNEFFGRDLSHFLGSDDLKRNMPSVNITASDVDYTLRMLAPGFRKEDLKMHLENDVLTISAEQRDEQLRETEQYTRREFSHSAFSRSFRLPEDVDGRGISASFRDGVLQVTLPKREESKPRVQQIDIA
jgi:HSP20 family protein